MYLCNKCCDEALNRKFSICDDYPSPYLWQQSLLNTRRQWEGTWAPPLMESARESKEGRPAETLD